MCVDRKSGELNGQMTGPPELFGGGGTTPLCYTEIQ